MSGRIYELLPATFRRRFDELPKSRVIVSNLGWLIGDQLVRLGVSLAIGVLTARYLGPERFGMLNYAFAIVGIFSTLSALGLDGIVVRELVKDRAKESQILGTAFVLQLAGGACSVLLANVTAACLRSNDSLVLSLVFAASIGSLVYACNVIDLWFRSQVQSKHVVRAKAVAFLASAAVKLAAIVLRSPLTTFAWIASLELTMSAIALAIAYRRAQGRISAWRVTGEQAQALLLDSWPLVFSGLVTMIYMKIDQVMLGKLVDTHEVGLYAVGSRLASSSQFLPMAIASSTLPSVIAARTAGDDRSFYAHVQRLYGLAAFSGYTVAIAWTLAAKPLVAVLFGQSYMGAERILMILAWSGLFTHLGVARTSYLTAMNWTRAHFFTVALGCALNVVLNLILIPRYGGMGAAAASLGASWFAAYGTCFLYKPLFRTGGMLTRALLFPKFW